MTIYFGLHVFTESFKGRFIHKLPNFFYFILLVADLLGTFLVVFIRAMKIVYIFDLFDCFPCVSDLKNSWNNDFFAQTQLLKPEFFEILK